MQSIKSSSVRSQTGHQSAESIFNLNPTLKEASINAEEKKIRIRNYNLFTQYRRSSDKNSFRGHFIHFRNLLPTNLVYENPIADQ